MLKTFRSKSSGSRIRAFTLVELLVTIGLLIVLVSALVPAFETFRKRAKRVQCISHLRAIHGGLLGHVNDVGHWPQMEGDRADYSEEEFFEFWVEATKPYGLSEDTWVCPADRGLERRRNPEEQKYFGSYVPTQFNDNPKTPFRWNQPWVMERGNMHGEGAHVLLPDGSVHSMNNPFFGR